MIMTDIEFLEKIIFHFSPGGTYLSFEEWLKLGREILPEAHRRLVDLKESLLSENAKSISDDVPSSDLDMPI